MRSCLSVRSRIMRSPSSSSFSTCCTNASALAMKRRTAFATCCDWSGSREVRRIAPERLRTIEARTVRLALIRARMASTSSMAGQQICLCLLCTC